MTFLQQLQTHKGGLLRLKTQLYWYSGRGYDKNPGRVCLVLDIAAARGPAGTRTAATAVAAATRRGATAKSAAISTAAGSAAAHLLIDGVPRWIWLADEDVELL